MIRFEDFEALGVAVCGMTEVSDGDCSLRGGATDGALAGRRSVCAACGVDATQLVRGGQVHSVNIAPVTSADAGRGAMDDATCLPQTDGLLTAERGLPLAVLVADCVPVFLYDAEGGAGGILHAGREGTLGDISGKAVEEMGRLFGSTPDNIFAFIGPSAGPESYEVSEEIARQWKSEGLPLAGRYLDLWEANARQLEMARVPRENIRIAGLDTITDSRFFSYRRDGTMARNMALLML
jgi:polyphenol oxidase